MILLIWLLIAYGQTNIMVYGSIFNNTRDTIHKWASKNYAPFQGLGKFISALISCMMCMSTWVGFFLSLAFYSPSHELVGSDGIMSIFFDGMLASGFVWAINSIIEWFEENRPNNNK